MVDTVRWRVGPGGVDHGLPALGALGLFLTVAEIKTENAKVGEGS